MPKFFMSLLIIAMSCSALKLVGSHSMPVHSVFATSDLHPCSNDEFYCYNKEYDVLWDTTANTISVYQNPQFSLVQSFSIPVGFGKYPYWYPTVTRYWFDTDDGFEVLYSQIETVVSAGVASYNRQCKVIEDDGTILFEDATSSCSLVSFNKVAYLVTTSEDNLTKYYKLRDVPVASILQSQAHLKTKAVERYDLLGRNALK